MSPRAWDLETVAKVTAAEGTLATLNALYGLGIELRPLTLEDLGSYGLGRVMFFTDAEHIYIAPESLPDIRNAVRHAFTHVLALVRHRTPPIVVSRAEEGSDTADVTEGLADAVGDQVVRRLAERFDRLEAIVLENTRLLSEIRDAILGLRPGLAPGLRVPREGPQRGSTAGQILLHLFKHEDEVYDGEASFSVTATAIGSAVGLSAPGASAWLNALISAGFMIRAQRGIRGLVRGPGQRRRYWTYMLTPRGRSWALRHQPVQARCMVHPAGCPMGVEATT